MVFPKVRIQPLRIPLAWTALAGRRGQHPRLAPPGLADLQSKGVLSLDVFPEEMTAPLVNSYLEIKARRLL